MLPELTNIQFSVGRWFFLGTLAVVLAYFAPLAVLAAVPLTISSLLYGRAKGFAFAALAITLLVVATAFTPFPPYVVILFSYALVVAQLGVLVIKKNLEPTFGIYQSGFLIIGVIGFLFAMLVILSGKGPSELLLQVVTETLQKFKAENVAYFKGTSEDVRLFNEVLGNPSKIVTEIMNWGAAYVWVAVFFSVWINLFMALRGSIVWRRKIRYDFTTAHLLSFKVPYFIVYFVIIGLFASLGAGYLPISHLDVIGGNILWCLGIFYFFQGFGVFIEFLGYLKVVGFFRNLLVVMSVMLAWKLIALAGVLDTWIDFRKYFVKKIDKDEGDLL